MTDTYQYDAFGNLIANTGTTANNYLFSGEALDSAVGLYYLRARYYRPATGRFWTADPYAGSVQDPPTLNKYMYRRQNPVNRVDPSGRDAILEYAIELGEEQKTIEELRLVDLAVRDELLTACIQVSTAAFEDGGLSFLEAYNLAKVLCNATIL